MEVADASMLHEALEHLRTAYCKDCEGKYPQDALESYMNGASLLMDLVKNDKTGAQMRQILQRKCQQYVDRVRTIKRTVENREEHPPHPHGSRKREHASAGVLSSLEEMNQLGIKESFQEVMGLKTVKEFMWRNVAVPLMFPGYPDPVTRIKRGVLFYGLAGSGKTKLINALTSTVSCPVVRVLGSTFILNCYGAEERIERMQRLFQWARSEQPCLVCVDDLDVLCERGGDGDSTEAKILEELLQNIQNITSDYQVTVIAGALRPWYLPGKLTRRLDRRFYFHLPDAADRAAIFRHQLSSGSGLSITHKLTDADVSRIGEVTVDLTGADVSYLVRSSMMQPVRRLQSATHFCFVMVRTPSAEGEEKEQKMLTSAEGEEKEQKLLTSVEGEEKEQKMLTSAEGEEQEQKMLTSAEGEEKEQKMLTTAEGEEKEQKMLTTAEGEEKEQKMLTSTEGEKKVQKMLTPCDPDYPGALEISLDFLNLDRVHPPDLTMEMVERVLKDTRSSVAGSEELGKMTQWMQDFGQEE